MRRVPPPASPAYSSVPTQMPSSPPAGRHQRYASNASSDQSHTGYYHSPPQSQDEHVGLMQRSRRDYTTQGVATGSIGGGYGPYTTTAPRFSQGRFSNMSNASDFSEKAATTAPATPAPQPPAPRTNTVGYLWDSKDPDLDDALHNPDPVRDAILDKQWTLWSLRGWANFAMIGSLMLALIILFAGWPVISWVRTLHPSGPGYNLGGINSTGQIPDLHVPMLIDQTTPKEALTRTGFDGQQYVLVFSDEFNTDGRSFYAGDDPFWEAVDLHYWLTDAITTKDGNLVLTLTETPIHGLDFKSGMLQSWNKFCFTTGYIEVNISLPGDPRVPGLWPAAWTMGNLGRIGHGATTDGLWPYSYDSCDIGTFPNQTAKDGPPVTTTDGRPLSFQPGQRLSACSCPGSDHPGPTVSRGRGAPEIDIIEAETNLKTWRCSSSQSMQMAPYDADWEFDTSVCTIYNETGTEFNTYKGGTYQQAISSLTDCGITAYNGTSYQTYGFEYWSDPKNRGNGYVTWAQAGQPTWTIPASAIGPNRSGVSQRLISEEPMSIALNLGLAPSFQKQDWKNLRFPARMYVDYVRVYQRKGHENIGCDPPDYPTADYINRHINAYTNPNLTIWSQAGYTFPRNSAYDGCA
ncbi:hypothetical protein FS837_011528 [Tulasnella sp. UAMH 9824]|nr:hypothetical protein FS837_011528 [Tulasnella sp. UAMH 9824]